MPAKLCLGFKDDYLRMIAAAYNLDGDMARAMQRSGILRPAESSGALADLTAREPLPIFQPDLIHSALELAQPDVALARPTKYYIQSQARARQGYSDLDVDSGVFSARLVGTGRSPVSTGLSVEPGDEPCPPGSSGIFGLNPGSRRVAN